MPHNWSFTLCGRKGRDENEGEEADRHPRSAAAVLSWGWGAALRE